jgi:predicted transcriptional regulator
LLRTKIYLPVALVLQGPAGCGKSTVLDFFENCDDTKKTDRFTPHSFVSHMARKKQEELEKIDLLPKLKDKMFITPDLAPLFGSPQEQLRDKLSILTRVLDGRGLTTESGVYGTRGYSGDYYFVWIAASTPIPYRVWDLMGSLGARMLFLNMPARKKTERQIAEELRSLSYREKMTECRDATLQFTQFLSIEPKIEWNREKDLIELQDKIGILAKLLVRLRGKVNVSIRQEYNGEKVYHTTPIIEDPMRAALGLYNLARGHAVIQHRKQISRDDLGVVVNVALSSAPYDRVNGFKILLENQGKMITRDLMGMLRCSRSSAIRTMKTLDLLELANLKKGELDTKGGFQLGYHLTLKPEFEWFLDEKFQVLWRGWKGFTSSELRDKDEVREHPRTLIRY